MKKNILLTLVFSLTALCSLLGQSAKKSLNYQAVILDPKAIDIPGASLSGQPLSKGKVCLKFSFVNAQGNVDYEETQQTTTDEYGLVSLAVGTGTYNGGTYKNFESIVWDANVKSMRVAVSYDGCTSFKQVSTQALNYTPYALYAEAVDYKNVKDAPTKLSQFSNDAGYLIPKDLDPLKADIKTNTADIKTNAADIKTNTADIKTNTADIKTNAAQIASANQSIADNKKSSDESFLVVNQSIRDLGTKVTSNTNSIVTIEGKINEQQNLINDTRNQLNNTTSSINGQINGLQNQVNTTANTVNTLVGDAQIVANKSTATNLGGASPSDVLYPSQKAAKTYVDNAIYNAVGTGVADATTLAPGKVQLAGDLAGTATAPTVPGLANKENTSNKSTNVTTDGNSDIKYPSAKAVKTYVDQATQGIALQAAVDAKADKNSPVFTGTPNLPTGTIAVTQTPGDNTTNIATTAFVQAATAAGIIDASSTTKGKLKLTGDLGGTAESPTVPGLALKANSTDVNTALALKENASNKSTATALGTSNELYPTQNAVKVYVDAQIASATIADADASTKGKIQLAGDLGGTAASPTVPGLALKANSADVNTSLALKAPINNPTFTGTVGGITSSMVGLGNVDNTSDANKPVSTATQTALDLKASLASPTFTGSPSLPTGTTAITQLAGDNSTKLATTEFVTTKLASGAPDATTTATGKVQLAGDLGGTAASPTVPGLALKANTADVNTSLGLKAPINNPTFTGTVAGITSSMVGLGNVDNTSDANKPVSSATQTALDLKASLASPTFTGAPTAPTATAGTNTTQIATTEFVTTSLASANISIGTIAGSSTANGASITSGVINLAPANGTNGGIVTTGTQTIAGAKTFTSDANVNGITVGRGGGNKAFNTAIGISALLNNSGGEGNTASGERALSSNTDGNENTANGWRALYLNTTGNKNTVSGSSALLFNADGNSNTAIGYRAGRKIADDSGNNTTSDFSVYLGSETKASSDGAQNEIVIGYNAIGAGSNTIQLGNTSITNVKTSGTLTAGDVTYPKTHGTSGQVLGTTGSGSLTWTTPTSISIGAIGTATTNGASIASGVLSLTPADGTNGGIVTTGTQTIAGAKTFTSDAIVNGITVGRGGGDSGYNTAFGLNALLNNTGSGNTAVGRETLIKNENSYNSAFGYQALKENKYGSYNVAVGSSALFKNTDGSINVAIGNNSLSQNTVGSNNTAIGNNTLTTNTIGSNNTAIGNSANVASADLTNATALGYQAKVSASNTIQLGADGTWGSVAITNVKTSGTLTAGTVTYPNTPGTSGQVLTTDGTGTATWADASGGVPYTGATQAVDLGLYDLTVNGIKIGSGGGSNSTNTAIGFDALSVNAPDGDNDLGINNTAIGMNALLGNITGANNTATGRDALFNNTTGLENAATGAYALFNNTTGSYNTAYGKASLLINTEGSNNTAIGYGADVGSDNLTNATAIGNRASVTTSNTIQLGNTDVTDVKTSGTLTAGDVTYPKTHGTSGQVLGTTGSGSLTWTTPATISIGTIAGSSTANGASITSGVINLAPADETNGGIVTTGTQTIAGAKTFTSDANVNGITVGKGGGNVSTNVATGSDALKSNTTGNKNTAIGYFALEKNTNSFNTAIGSEALKDNTSGDNNTASGASALTSNTTGVNNTAYGSSTLLSNTTGAGNTAIGISALMSNTTNGALKGDNNTAIGNSALRYNTTGSDNTASGTTALIYNTTGSANTAIGNYAGSYITNGTTDNTTSDYSVYLGSNTKASADDAQNEVVIGYNAIGAGSNTIQLGNTSVTNVKTSGAITAGGKIIAGASSAASSSAVLEANSTTQGFLPPRLTTTQRNAITSPTEGLTLWNTENKQLEVYNGTYWVTMDGKLVSPINVGDSYGGGKVAYIFTSSDLGYVAGQTHGLIAAVADQTTDAGIPWFPDKFYGATVTGIGLGLPNTISIIAAAVVLGKTDMSSYAAGLANNYKGGGYSDWFLPSRDELNKLFINRAAIGGFATTGTIATYWSSSQKGSMNFNTFNNFANGISSAYQQFFFAYNGNSEGTQNDLGISNPRRVRAVRIF